MDNVFEELNNLYEEDNNLPTLLDIVRCSTIMVIADDVRNFTHSDAEKIAAQFNYADEVDFDEYFDESLDEDTQSPLAGRSPDKFVVQENEVREVLRKITSNYIIVNTNSETPSGRKNVRLMNELNLSEDDIRELAKQLNLGDYSFSAPSRQPQFAGHILTFFITKKDFTLSDGREFNDLQVYVKVDTTADGIVTAISFHRATGRISHPYEGQI